MRCAALSFLSLIMLAACDRADAPSTAPANDAGLPAPVVVAASDEITGLSGAPKGVAFWTHPNVAFNSLVIVASGRNVVSYNIEDGAEVSRLPDLDAHGAAVSYIGFGPQARGLFATFDSEANAVKLFAIDNATRAFQPIDGEIAVRGAVRDLCLGRAQGAETPTLVILQKGKLTRYALRIEDSMLVAKGEVAETAPDDAVSCAVDNDDGAVFLGRASGALMRMAADAPPAEFAAAPIGAAGDIAVVLSSGAPDSESSVNGLVLLLDEASGAVHAFDRNSGALAGVVTVGESFEIDGIDAATAMTATGANLGGLYRNGVAAFGVDLGEGVGAVRMIPVNGLLNALDRPEGAPSSPRGYTPQTDDDALIIPSVNSPE